MRAILLTALVALAGCSIESGGFAPTLDAPPAPDGGDDQLRIVATPEVLELGEDDTATLLVHLSRQPEQGVTVSLTGEAGVAAVDPAILVFTSDDYAVDQQVVVTAIPDDDTADEAGELTLESGGAGPSLDVPVTVIDDDDLLLVVSVDSLTVGEQGGGDVLVHLSAEPPPGDLIVAASLGGSGAAMVTPTELTFDVSNWDQDQTLHVHGIEDANTVSETLILTLSNASVPDQTIALTVTDDDTLNIGLTTGTVNIVEGGGNGSFGVFLTQDPGGPRVVTLGESSDAFHLGSASLTFTSANYGDVQTVSVIPDDDDDIADESGQITVASVPLTAQSITVNVDDDDQQEILTNVVGTMLVSENSATTFTVRLRFRPASSVTVTIGSTDLFAAAPSPATLIFLPGDFDQPQQVEVTGVNDVDLVDESPTISLSASVAPTVSFPVAVDDEDVQAIVLSSPSVTVTEGTTSTMLRASLAFQPPAGTSNVTVSSDSAAITVASPLGFTPANYMAGLAVSVTAPGDSNTSDESATLTFMGGGAATPVTATATVDDQTMITNLGWPTFFNTTTVLDGGYALAYRFSVASTTTLDRLGVLIGSAGGDAKMAIYADNLNVPGALVAASNSTTSLTQVAPTANLIDVADVTLQAGTYWLAIRVSPEAAVGYRSATTTRRCLRVVANLSDAWPSPFGTSTCGDTGAVNIFAMTYQ